MWGVVDPGPLPRGGAPPPTLPGRCLARGKQQVSLNLPSAPCSPRRVGKVSRLLRLNPVWLSRGLGGRCDGPSRSVLGQEVETAFPSPHRSLLGSAEPRGPGAARPPPRSHGAAARAPPSGSRGRVSPAGRPLGPGGNQERPQISLLS